MFTKLEDIIRDDPNYLPLLEMFSEDGGRNMDASEGMPSASPSGRSS